MAGANKAATAKVVTSAPAELVVMVAKEPVKYGGKRHLPGDPLLALPDDLPGLIDAGLAEVADIQEDEAK